MARAGMEHIIQRLRRLCEAGTADYTLVEETYWQDNHLQDELDLTKQLNVEINLAPVPQYVDGTTIYKIYEIPEKIKWYESPLGGSTVFKITDSGGSAIATANFTVDLYNNLVHFTANQGASARYYTGYSYDMLRAAIEIWGQKASHAFKAIDFSADGQRFTRSAIHKHCIQMQNNFIDRQGIKAIKLTRTDMQGVQGTFK